MNEKNKKITIISLSCIIVVLLIILFIPKDNSKTVMIYMVGSNLESELGIATDDIDGILPDIIDLENTNVLLYTGGTIEWKNFISNEENAIYALEKDGFKKIKTYDKENMGSPNTLAEFLNYSYNNYKSGKYDLILYDHGGAIDGAIYDDFTGDNLSLNDFKEALENSHFNSRNKMDVVIFSTCLNGTIEVSNIFKDFANYLVFSEEVSYGVPGYSVLGFVNETNQINGIDFGKKYIDYYDVMVKDSKIYGYNNITYSIVDLSRIDKLNNEFDNFINELNVKDNYSDILNMRANLFQYAYEEAGDEHFDTVDLYSLVNGLGSYSNYDYRKVLDVINDIVIYNYSNDEETSHGISVYFPYNGSKTTQRRFLDIYNNINYSDNYKKFINDVFNFRKNNVYGFGGSAQNETPFNKDLTDNVISKNGNVSMSLDNDIVKDYARASLDIYIKTKDYPTKQFSNVDENIYSLIYTTSNGKLNGNSLNFEIEKNFVELYNDNTFGYISVMERDNNEGQVEKRFDSYGKLGLLSDTVNAKFYFEYENDIPVLRIATYTDMNENSIKKRESVLNINNYDDIYFNIYAYKFGNDGKNLSYVDDTVEDKEIDKNLRKYTISLNEKTSNFKLRKATYYNNLDYYAKITLYDIYGNTNETRLVKINK